MNIASIISIVATGGIGLFAGALALRFLAGRRRAAQAWADRRYNRFDTPGSVQHLSILPLIDDSTAQEGLHSESGVSYLIRADDTTLLFDTGLNQAGEHPSPLLKNMAQLGVTLEQIKMVVISHLHLDHVGGMRKQARRTFDLSAQPVNLSGIPAFLPTSMTHPTAEVQVVDAPRIIAPGIATLVPIPRQLFFFGWTPEQSLAINVQGKGLVIVIGCGHSGLQHILARAEMLFDAPVYGVVGGLHFPITEKSVQRYLGTDNWPWKPANKQSVQDAIASLKSRSPQLVALSPHDSCAWSRTAFQQAFAGAYHDIRVGEQLEI